VIFFGLAFFENFSSSRVFFLVRIFRYPSAFFHYLSSADFFSLLEPDGRRVFFEIAFSWVPLRGSSFLAPCSSREVCDRAALGSVFRGVPAFSFPGVSPSFLSDLFSCPLAQPLSYIPLF